MLKRIILLIFVIISLFSFSLLFSNTIIVDINGHGDYLTIQEGINAAVNGDTLLVYPGTYYENINYNGKNITVASKYLTTGNNSYIHSTIIDGNQNGSVVTFESGEDSTAVLCGFTIQNGSGTQQGNFNVGGGIFCINSQTTLKNCIIKDNLSEFGAGICLYYTTINMNDLCIFNNHAISWAGGIGFNNAYANFDQIKRCNIYLNYAGDGSDLRAFNNNNSMTAFIDTFTVAEPNDYYVAPIDKFVFDIQNSKIELLNYDLYVSPQGNNNNSGLNPSEPLQTISWAVTKIKSDSINNNTIYLSSGTYSPITTNEMFPLNCKDYVSIIGENRDNTILDGNDTYYLFHSNEDSDYLIEDITIQHGLADITGGGICIYDGLNIIVKNVNFFYNRANTGGGAINIFNSQGVFENLIIRNNCSDGGGGLFISNNSNPAFINCIIDSNYTITPGWGFAGGVSCNVESNPIFINTTITNNVSDQTSGFSASGGAGSYCDPILINCTIYNNSANPGGTIFQGDNSNISLINCILRNPSENEIVFSTSAPPETVMVAYCNIDGGIDAINTNNNGTIHWLEGNIDSIPQFVGGDPFSYELLEGSPCIDAGTPDTTGLNLPPTDLAGNPRIYNGRIDIGAYEWRDTNSVVTPDTSFINKLYLFQNKPNPFRESTTITFISADFERIKDYKLSIYNAKGQLIRTYNGRKHNFWVKTDIVWDGTDEEGKKVSPGMYFYKLEYGNNAVARKMLLLR